MEKMDSSYTFDGMVEKEQETVCLPTKDADDKVQGKGDEVEEGVEEGTTIEPYVLFLQKFLGEQLAQQFLDPSYEVPVNTVHPLLLGKKGQSAKDYWRLLREHSEAQLQEMITSQGTIKGSLFNMMQSSKFVDHIQDFRRTLEIMYTSSKINQDKAVLIMSNNPLFDFNEWQKNESPMQFVCKEVIQAKLSEKHFLQPSVMCTDSNEDSALSEQGTEAGKKRYRFVTEDTCKKFTGEFSKHFTERKSEVFKGSCNQSRCIELPSINVHEHKTACSSHMTEHAATGRTWEPLTYTALMDSRPSITAPGKGAFGHGEPTKWANYSNTDQY